MNSAVAKKFLDPAPRGMPRLLENDEIGQRIWKPDELATMLRYQMTTPLQIDLARVNGAASALRDETGSKGLLLSSVGDLLRHPHPPVALLKLMKDFGKACRLSPASAMPREISSVIYFASIVAAMTRCSRRITRLDSRALRRAVTWVLEQRWIDDSLRALFLEGRQFLSGETSSGGAPAPTAPGGG